MGYTMVTAFPEHFYQEVREAIGNAPANKIPFGRECNRENANAVLNYHVTLVHWKEKENDIYLPRRNRLQFTPFSLKVVGTSIITPSEGGYLLLFDVEEADGYPAMREKIEKAMGLPVSRNLHITLAVDMEEQNVCKLQTEIDRKFKYPFDLPVVGLDLYHVWRPVRLNYRIRSQK